MCQFDTPSCKAQNNVVKTSFFNSDIIQRDKKKRLLIMLLFNILIRAQFLILNKFPYAINVH